MQNREQKPHDGPIKVDLGDIYERGETKIEDVDAATLPTLPPGYSPLPKAYRITTKAVVAGTCTIVFAIPSITDAATFHNLRVFHAESDKFDPDALLWTDRTADAPSDPDFSRKTITATSDELGSGMYVIGRLVKRIAPSKAVADLELVDQPEPERVQMPANITVSAVVRNNGPQAATDVGFRQQFIVAAEIISIKSSQGTCKSKPFHLYCKLGQLANGKSATISVVLNPGPDFAGFYDSFVEVEAKETDNNTDNNSGRVDVPTLADRNLRPEVTFETQGSGSPPTVVGEQLFESGETLVFSATATDPDGSIDKVEFQDNDQSMGFGSSTDAQHFSFSTNQLRSGGHVMNAVAIDNGGRRTRSNTIHIFVNGPVKLQILDLPEDASLTSGSELSLTAEVTSPIGALKSIEFFYNGGFSLGTATAVGNNRFTIKIKRLEITNYTFEAVAVDTSGLISKSKSVRFSVTK